MAKKLTTAAVRNLRPTNKRRVIRDSGGQSLYLVIQSSGSKSWMMRFRRPDGRPGKLFLGPVDMSGRKTSGEPPVIGAPLSLVSARWLAADVQDQRSRGADPIADNKARKHRRRAEIVERSANSFAAAARSYIDEHASRHTRRWRETARVLGLVYAGDGSVTPTRGGLAARWADRAVASIDAHDIHAAIDESRRSALVLARVLSHMFTWLVRNRRIDVKPSIHVPSPPRARDRVLDAGEIKAMWRAAERVSAPYAAVIRLLLLTGCRLREISELRWDEIAADGKMISIPGARTKNHRAHLVPLAPLARDILTAQPRRADCAFVLTTDGRKPIQRFSTWKKRLDALMPGVARWRVHDLRRTAATHMGEMGERTEVIEAALNHASGARGGIIGVYNRATLLPERKAALEKWARRVQAIVSGRGRS
jgi:integrase